MNAFAFVCLLWGHQISPLSHAYIHLLNLSYRSWLGYDKPMYKQKPQVALRATLSLGYLPGDEPVVYIPCWMIQALLWEPTFSVLFFSWYICVHEANLAHTERWGSEMSRPRTTIKTADEHRNRPPRAPTTNVLIAIIGCQTKWFIITAAAGKAMAFIFLKGV